MLFYIFDNIAFTNGIDIKHIIAEPVLLIRFRKIPILPEQIIQLSYLFVPISVFLGPLTATILFKNKKTDPFGLEPFHDAPFNRKQQPQVIACFEGCVCPVSGHTYRHHIFIDVESIAIEMFLYPYRNITQFLYTVYLIYALSLFADSLIKVGAVMRHIYSIPHIYHKRIHCVPPWLHQNVINSRI